MCVVNLPTEKLLLPSQETLRSKKSVNQIVSAPTIYTQIVQERGVEPYVATRTEIQ